MADLLENLNEKQREAVLETEGYVRVIAGAGSGKTKLLVSRYAYLVQEYGIDSSNILCVTFTNKAAGEMKTRIRKLIGEEHGASLVCTYHGFCHRLLRENPEKLFLNKQFQIIDSQQQKAFLSEIYQKHELKLDYASFESILRKIGLVKRDTGYVTRICNPEPCQILNEIKDQDDRIIEEFLQRQKATYSLDFHDLISFAIYVLETDAEIREKWQDRLNYIMVDEFQDSSSIEMRLVDILSDKFRNLMIVGDPDQNIYEWRGSDVKLLVDFDQYHEPTRTIILNQNYRSTPQILQCANTLIEKNEIRLKKDLFTHNQPGAPVVHYHSKSDLEEMDQVISNIKRLSEKEGYKYSDFAILYRSGFLSRIAEKKLVEKNIPYEIFGGVRFYQRMEILDILAYLKLIAYDDDVSFRRIINTPRRRFGRAKMNYLEELRKYSAETSVYQRDLFELFSEESGIASVGDEHVGSGSAGGSYGNGLNYDRTLFATLSEHLDEREFINSEAGAFVRFIESMRGSYKSKRISDIVNEVTKDSGYESYIRELGDEERLDNLAEFKRIANEFEREFGENLSLEEFLQQIALQSEENSKESKDTVKLMTIHSSKGLEFQVVFILGFTEGVFPSSKTLGDRKKPGLEEERRLCYVAITRAKKYLFLMESEGTSQNGIKKLISRFLEEIGEKNYVRIGRISDELAKESRGYTAKLNHEMQLETAGSRKVGDIVEHHVFGKGTIEAIDTKRGSYAIKFEKLQQVRNISSSYFMKKHEDLGPKNCEAKESAPKEAAAGKPREKADRADVVIPGKTEKILAGVEEYQEAKECQEVSGYQEANECQEVSEYQEASECQKISEYQEASECQKVSEYQEAKECQEVSEYQGASECQEVSEYQEASECQETDEWEDVDEWQEDLTLSVMNDRLWNPELYEDNAEEASNIGEKKEIACESGEAVPFESEQPGSEELKALQTAQIKKLKENSSNLWKQEEVPHSGWSCVGVEDLGAPVGICEMCGYQIIRYAHHMEHPKYRSLSVGCVCAGRMEGDVAEAKRREADFKNRQARRMKFFQRKWKRSKKGNEYLKIDGHVLVLYSQEKGKHIWKYAIDNEFCRMEYTTRERAIAGIFDALEQIRSGQK